MGNQSDLEQAQDRLNRIQVTWNPPQHTHLNINN